MIFVIIMNIIDIIDDKHKDNAKSKHNHNDLCDCHHQIHKERKHNQYDLSTCYDEEILKK